MVLFTEISSSPLPGRVLQPFKRDFLKVPQLTKSRAGAGSQVRPRPKP